MWKDLKQEKKKSEVAIQTVEPEVPPLTKRKTDLLIENEQLKRTLAKYERRIDYHKNKENKFLFFLFSL